MFVFEVLVLPCLEVVSWLLARAKRERVVQDGVEKANRRPTDPARHDTTPLAPYLKFDHF